SRRRTPSSRRGSGPAPRPAPRPVPDAPGGGARPARRGADRGLHFARLEPQRSYAASYRVPSPPLQGMYLSADSSTRSLRTVPLADGEQLVVGGNGHVVGRHRGPTSELVADL